MRPLAALLVVFGLVAVLLVMAGEVVVKPAAEASVGELIQRRYQLSTRPSVELNGFPFAVRVLTGRLDSVVVSLEGYEAGGLRVARFGLRLEPVTFQLVPLLRGEGEVRTGKGTAEARLTGADVTAYLRAHGQPLAVSFDSGTATVSRPTDLGTVVATGRLAFSEGVLRFSPDRLTVGSERAPDSLTEQLAFTVPVPAIAGVQVTSVTARPGEVSLTADVTGYVISRLAHGGVPDRGAGAGRAAGPDRVAA